MAVPQSRLVMAASVWTQTMHRRWGARLLLDALLNISNAVLVGWRKGRQNKRLRPQGILGA